MSRLLLAMPSPALGLVITAVSVAAALALLQPVRRRTADHPPDADDNAAITAVYSMVGVIYAVILGFVVVIVWQQFGDAAQVVNREVTSLGGLLRHAQAFPPAVREDTTERVLAYARAVADDDWPAMEHGRSSPVALAAYERIWQAYYAYKPTTSREEAFRAESLDILSDLSANRRQRILASRASVPPLLWSMLLLGGVVVVGCTLALGVTSAVLHALLVSVVALVVAVALFLVVSLDHPFLGSVSIRPDAYRDLIATWT